MLPPCHDVLIQHIKRVSYQTHIWQRSLDQFIRVDSPVGNGWFMDDSRLDIQWMTCYPMDDMQSSSRWSKTRMIILVEDDDVDENNDDQ